MVPTLVIHDSISSQLEKLRKDFPEIGDDLRTVVSYAAKEHLLKNYLSGQVLNLSDKNKGPFYSKKSETANKITGRIFNLFEGGRKVISNLSGKPVDTGKIDMKKTLHPTADDMKSKINDVLKMFLSKHKKLQELMK